MKILVWCSWHQDMYLWSYTCYRHLPAKSVHKLLNGHLHFTLVAKEAFGWGLLYSSLFILRTSSYRNLSQNKEKLANFKGFPPYWFQNMYIKYQNMSSKTTNSSYSNI